MSEYMEKQGQEIRQTAITLPYFDFEVPVLYLENGTPYILVIALCEMLGLQALRTSSVGANLSSGRTRASCRCVLPGESRSSGASIWVHCHSGSLALTGHW